MLNARGKLKLYIIIVSSILIFDAVGLCSSDDGLSYTNLFAAKKATFLIDVDIVCNVCSEDRNDDLEEQIRNNIKKWFLLFDVPYIDNDKLESNPLLAYILAGFPLIKWKSKLEKDLNTSLDIGNASRYYIVNYIFQTTQGESRFAYISQLKVIGTMNIIEPSVGENKSALGVTLWDNMYFGFASSGAKDAEELAVKNAKELIENFAYQYKKMIKKSLEDK